MILIIICQTTLIFSQAEKKEKLTDRQIWDKLTDDQKYESFKTANNSYYDLKEIDDARQGREELLVRELEKDVKLLKSIKNPFISLSIGAGFVVDEKINIDIEAQVDLQIYLNKYFYIEPYVTAKLKQNIGGGIGVKVGFLLYK